MKLTKKPFASSPDAVINEISQEKWERGYANEPARAGFDNKVINNIDTGLHHINERGVVSWDEHTVYKSGAISMQNKILYRLTAESSQGHDPEQNPNVWVRMDHFKKNYQTFADASLQHVKDLTKEEKNRLAGKIASIRNEGGTIVTRNGEGGINCTKININLESNTFDPSKIVVSGDDNTAFLTSKSNAKKALGISKIESDIDVNATPNTIVKRDENGNVNCNRIENFIRHSKYDAFQEFFPIGTLHTRPIYNNRTITLTNGQTIAVRWMVIQPDRVLMTETEGTAPSYQGDQWAVNGRTAEVRLRNNQVPWNGRTQTRGGNYVWAAKAVADLNHQATHGHSHTLNLHSYHCTWYRRTQ
ncbi:MAG: hypothetical protein AAF195_00925 [Pseudomonadota bacterium]